MKIMHAISYGYLAGGAEQSVSMLKDSLIKNGHDVLIISSNHDDGGKQFSDIKFPEIDAKHASLTEKLVNHLWYKKSYSALKSAITEFKPDIVHFHTMGQFSPSAISAIGKTPGILTVHGPEEYVSSIVEWSFPQTLYKNGVMNKSYLTYLGKLYYFYYRFIQRPIYKRVFSQHLKLLIAPSEYMEKVLISERFGVDVRQLYNGIALPKALPLINKSNLLYVGRLETVKGVNILLEALQTSVKTAPSIKLDIVGSGSAKKDLVKLVTDYHLTDNVTFWGWLSNQEVRKKYEQATAVIIPSIWPENLPTVCIEALACGRPVIGTRTGGIPELINSGETGFIVSPGSSSELAEAILSLNSLISEDLSNKCHKSVNKFVMNKFTEQLLNIYSEVSEVII